VSSASPRTKHQTCSILSEVAKSWETGLLSMLKKRWQHNPFLSFWKFYLYIQNVLG
jgi:hypothetical protein